MKLMFNNAFIKDKNTAQEVSSNDCIILRFYGYNVSIGPMRRIKPIFATLSDLINYSYILNEKRTYRGKT